MAGIGNRKDCVYMGGVKDRKIFYRASREGMRRFEFV